jgi:hypothetical protein
MTDQRRDRRTVLNIPVELTREGSPERHPARITNISLGGMFIETDLRLAFRAPVLVRVHVMRDESVVLPALVRWTRRDGVGVQFGLLGARSTFLIVQLARNLESAETVGADDGVPTRRGPPLRLPGAGTWGPRLS